MNTILTATGSTADIRDPNNSACNNERSMLHTLRVAYKETPKKKNGTGRIVTPTEC